MTKAAKLGCPQGVHMTTVRLMTVVLLIAGSGLLLNVARTQQPGIKRTDVLRYDLGEAGREVIQVRVDFTPGSALAGTRIRARRSPMYLKARWSISLTARRR